MSIEEGIKTLLLNVGEDIFRGGLVDTPSRAAEAWRDWTSGYKQNPEDILKTFEDGAEYGGEILIVKKIPFYSHCEHHLAPFFGEVSIAYIPDGKIVGLSKFSRLVDIFAKRLQVQERLTNQIATTIADILNPLAVGVKVSARHLCMESRGICKQGSFTESFATRGLFINSEQHRREFIRLINND